MSLQLGDILFVTFSAETFYALKRRIYRIQKNGYFRHLINYRHGKIYLPKSGKDNKRQYMRRYTDYTHKRGYKSESIRRSSYLCPYLRQEQKNHGDNGNMRCYSVKIVIHELVIKIRCHKIKQRIKRKQRNICGNIKTEYTYLFE